MTSTAMQWQFDQGTVDTINTRAREAKPGRAVLTLIAAVLFGVGFLTARSLSVVFLAGAWSWAAFRTGYEASHGPTRGQQLAALTAERDALLLEVERLS